MGPKATR